MFRFAPALIPLLLAACNGSPGPSENDPEETATDSLELPAGETFDLAPYDLPLQVIVPDAKTAKADSVEIRWEEERGWLKVRRGEHFDLRITEQPGDMARLKADLERDPLRKNTVLVESPGSITYRQEFPADTSLVLVHFLTVVKAAGREFTVESAPNGRFNEEDVERMVRAVIAVADEGGA